MLDSFDAMTLHAIKKAFEKFDPVPVELIPLANQAGHDLLTNGSASSMYKLTEKLENTPEYKGIANCYDQEYELLIDLQGQQQRELNKKSLQPEPDYLKEVLANCQFLKNYGSISNS